MSSHEPNVHTFPVAVGAGVTGIGAAITTDQLVKAAHGPHTKTHLAKAALGAAVTGAAFQYTKGLAEPDEDFGDHTRETGRSSHSRSRSSSSHSTHHTRALITGPPPHPSPPGPSGVTVNVGTVGGACAPTSRGPDSIEEYTTETDDECRREHSHSHDSEHHRRHHHRHRESHSEHEHEHETPRHHAAHLLEEAVGAYGVVKELLGDKHHHALHTIEGLIGAHAVGKEARDR